MTILNSSHRILGVDLASAAKKTGVCVVDWGGGRPRVETLEVGADDAEILRLQRSCDAIGIDSPFGWPEPFTAFLAKRGEDYVPEWTTDHRDDLRFRRTDFNVKELVNKWPLSVSSDLISVPAMRCAGLLARLGVEDFSGDGRVFEVYPAAALSLWGLLPPTTYKAANGAQVRALLVDQLCRQIPWLQVDARDLDTMKKSDDALDALICALVARAALLGLTDGPPNRDAEVARKEGWIHLPARDALARLVDGGIGREPNPSKTP